MKKHLPNNILLTPLFNFGLHRKNNSFPRQRENPSYKRKTEALENPIYKSLWLIEFVTFFGNLLEARGKIAIINTEDKRTFSYAAWFEGSGIKCYEGSWVPGIWSNPLLNDSLPDLVILLSLSSAERSSVLWDLQNLQLPLINLSTEHSEWNLFASPAQDHYQATHFYMEIIRYLVLRFQQGHSKFNSSAKHIFEKLVLHNQIDRLITYHYNRKISISDQTLWSYSKSSSRKNLKRWHIQKNLIYLKKPKKHFLKPFKTVRTSPPIKFLQKTPISGGS
jgi:hypothetical protein